jgi:replicative DNA helicase
VYHEAKSLANQLNIPVVLLAQYNRDVSGRPDKLAANSDIRYSAMVEILAGQIFHIYNPWQLELMGIGVEARKELPVREKRSFIITGKNKDGPSNIFEMGWEPTFTRWADPNELEF